MHTRLRALIARARRGVLYASAMVWRRLLFRTTFIAVTGSVGKTTAKECLAAILATAGPTFRSPDSKNSAASVARAILAVRPWHRFAVFEAGAYTPGWIRRTGGLVHPDLAVILAVRAVHLSHFPGLADIAREKSTLLECLTRRGTAVLSADDHHVAAMRPPAGRGIEWFSQSDATEVASGWPERLALTFRGRRVRTHLVGSHWLNSVLAALHAADVCGVRFEGTLALEPAPSRMQPVALPNGAIVLRDDFSRNSTSLDAAIETMESARASRKILLISSVADVPGMGNERKRADWLANKVACRFDEIFFVGDTAKRTRKGAIASGHPEDSVHAFKRHEEAAQALSAELREGDLLLVRDVGTLKQSSRTFHGLTGPVACTLSRCPKPNVRCDECEFLRAAPARSPNGAAL